MAQIFAQTPTSPTSQITDFKSFDSRIEVTSNVLNILLDRSCDLLNNECPRVRNRSEYLPNFHLKSSSAERESDLSAGRKPS